MADKDLVVNLNTKYTFQCAKKGRVEEEREAGYACIGADLTSHEGLVSSKLANGPNPVKSSVSAFSSSDPDSLEEPL